MSCLQQIDIWTWPVFFSLLLTELSGIDLFLADLKALDVYASYLYYLAKMWTKPLPEIYDPQNVTDYFSLRPHVVTLRLLEVINNTLTFHKFLFIPLHMEFQAATSFLNQNYHVANFMILIFTKLISDWLSSIVDKRDLKCKVRQGLSLLALAFKMPRCKIAQVN